MCLDNTAEGAASEHLHQQPEACAKQLSNASAGKLSPLQGDGMSAQYGMHAESKGNCPVSKPPAASSLYSGQQGYLSVAQQASSIFDDANSDEAEAHTLTEHQEQQPDVSLVS